MRTASVAELKARLSEYLTAAKRGEDVIVTDRGRAVARLTGLGGRVSRDAHLQALVRSGLVRPPRKKLPRDFFEHRLPPDPEGKLRQAIIQARTEGW